jgi:hypothetical protein
MRASLLLAVFSWFGCASDGKSTLSLTVDANPALAAVDHLHFVFTDDAKQRMSAPVDAAVGGPLPPSKTVPFQFPADVRGTVHVAVDALASDGTTLVSGGLDVAVNPGQTSTSALTLGQIVPPRMPDAARSTVSVDRSSGVKADGADAATVTVTVVDAGGMPIAGATVELTASGSNNVLSPTALTDATGVTTSKLTSTTAELKTITAVVDGVTLAQQPTVTFVPAVVVTLKFIKQPVAGSTQQALGASVAVVDGSGTPISTATNQITLTIGNNPGGSKLLGYPSSAAVAGVAGFELIGFDQPGTGYTLVASSPGLADVTSAAFDITPESPARVTVSGAWGASLKAITVAATTPPTLYTASGNEIFVSTNGAATWKPSTFGAGGGASQIVADPADASKVYAAAVTEIVGKPILLSTDGGQAWANGSGDLPLGGLVTQIAMVPGSNTVRYAAMTTGLYKSTNAGQNWTQLGLGNSIQFLSIGIDPTTVTTLYSAQYDSTAGTYKGVFKSVDSGVTWTAVNTGLPTTGARTIFVLTGAIFADVGTGMYVSTDGGASWNASAAFRGLAVAPSSPNIVYAGERGSVAVSTNGGVTFGTAVATGAYGVNALAVDPSDPTSAYAATDQGVYVTRDQGATWIAASIGMSEQSVSRLAAHPSAPSTLLVSMAPVSSPLGALYRTTDGGVTFSSVFGSYAPTDIAFDVTNPMKVVVCNGSDVRTSSDGGATWSAVTALPSGLLCQSLLINGTSWWAGTSSGLYSSTSGGAWTLSSVTASIKGLAIDANAATTFYAASTSGVYRSQNSGSTWTSVLSGSAYSVGTLPGSVVAPIGTGTSFSTDGGTSWSASAAGAYYTNHWAYSPNDIDGLGPTLFGASNGNFVWASFDGGNNFTQLNFVSEGNFATTDVAVSAGSAPTLWIGTSVGLYH